MLSPVILLKVSTTPSPDSITDRHSVSPLLSGESFKFIILDDLDIFSSSHNNHSASQTKKFSPNHETKLWTCGGKREVWGSPIINYLLLLQFWWWGLLAIWSLSKRIEFFFIITTFFFFKKLQNVIQMQKLLLVWTSVLSILLNSNLNRTHMKKF